MNLLTLNQLGTHSGLAVQTLRRLSTAGEIPAFKIGRNWYVDTDDWNEYLVQQKEKGAVTPSSEPPLKVGQDEV